ncbi:hypothetical protein J6590_033463 [Homalodisca vitripennis]|nr:hypothetical protein J6590_033463 [Homalodisca vitripennis]
MYRRASRGSVGERGRYNSRCRNVPSEASELAVAVSAKRGRYNSRCRNVPSEASELAVAVSASVVGTTVGAGMYRVRLAS